MAAKRKPDGYLSESGGEKNPRISLTSSPATSDAFEFDLDEEDVGVNDRYRLGAGANFVESPATSDLFETVSQQGELSPNTSDLFGPLRHPDHYENSPSTSIQSCCGFEPPASENDDIGCLPLEDSDEGESLSSSGKLKPIPYYAYYNIASKFVQSNSIVRACFIFLLCTLMTSANKCLENKNFSVSEFVILHSKTGKNFSKKFNYRWQQANQLMKICPLFL